MHYFSTLFRKELCMFWTDLLSIIRSLITLFTAIYICRTSYVYEIPIVGNTVLKLLMTYSKSV